MAYISAFTMRNRLAALVATDPIFTDDPLPFPNPIKKINPGSVDEATNIDICMVVPGQNFDELTLGGREWGSFEITGEVALLIYVFAKPGNPAAADQDALKEERAELLGELTTLALEAIFHFQTDPTPGDEMWNIMHLVPTTEGLHTTFYTTANYHLSMTRIRLKGEQYKS